MGKIIELPKKAWVQINSWKDTQNHESLWKHKLKPQWDTILHLFEWLNLKRLTILSVDKDVEQLKISYTACGNIK